VPIAGAPPFPGTALVRGISKGQDVCLVQARLRKLGFAIDKVAGCPFGPQTETAVKAFQGTHGLRPSGRVGRDTWKALFS
jgi:peptidoglycan hydrolase-like protein with peptidoglycan-binding domain